jgi:hypothetical protein
MIAIIRVLAARTARGRLRKAKISGRADGALSIKQNADFIYKMKIRRCGKDLAKSSKQCREKTMNKAAQSAVIKKGIDNSGDFSFRLLFSQQKAEFVASYLFDMIMNKIFPFSAAAAIKGMWKYGE